MEFGSVDYFKREILSEKEISYKKTVFVAYTKSLINSNRPASEKVRIIQNLIKAWEEVVAE